MQQTARVAAFIGTGSLPPGHFALDLKDDDPILPALDYFLTIKGIPGIRAPRNISRIPISAMMA